MWLFGGLLMLIALARGAWSMGEASSRAVMAAA
jgi:hypothetical protein